MTNFENSSIELQPADEPGENSWSDAELKGVSLELNFGRTLACSKPVSSWQVGKSFESIGS